MKTNLLFLLLATALFSVRCTHNYYYGTVYTTPGNHTTHVDHTYSSSGSQGGGYVYGSAGGGTPTGSGTPNTPRPTGTTTGGGTVTTPGRPTGDTPRPTGTPAGSGNPDTPQPTGSGTVDPPGRPTGPTTAALPGQISTRSLFRTWMHSYEEDEGQIQVYRPNNYAFPPSRGREGLTFQADGKVIHHGIAATDGTENNTGTWTLRNKTLQIGSIKEQRPYQLEIITLDNNVLKVKRR